jgi:hypothetical protein
MGSDPHSIYYLSELRVDLSVYSLNLWIFDPPLHTKLQCGVEIKERQKGTILKLATCPKVLQIWYQTTFVTLSHSTTPQPL